MTIKTQEHSDVMAQFERESKGARLDRELKEYWPLGRVYQDGHVNEVFLAYRRGYALAKSIYQIGSATDSSTAERAVERAGAQAQASLPSTSPDLSSAALQALLKEADKWQKQVRVTTYGDRGLRLQMAHGASVMEEMIAALRSHLALHETREAEAFKAGLETQRVYVGHRDGWEWFHQPSGRISKTADDALAAYRQSQGAPHGR